MDRSNMRMTQRCQYLRLAFESSDAFGIAGKRFGEDLDGNLPGRKAGVAGTYNREQYLPERKASLERWAAHIEQIVGNDMGKVTYLRCAL